MISIVPTPRTIRFARLLALVLMSVVCLTGGDCAPSLPPPPPPPPPGLIGDDPNTNPVATAKQDLIGLINGNLRGGLAPLQEDPLGDSVAQAHSDYMFATATLTEIMNGQDFMTRLLGAGVQPPISPVGVVAYGFSDTTLLMNAMQANSTVATDLRASNLTRIGVGLSGMGQGNYWTILVY